MKRDRTPYRQKGPWGKAEVQAEVLAGIVFTIIAACILYALYHS